MKKRLFILTIIIVCIFSALFIPTKYKSDIKVKYQHEEYDKSKIENTRFENGELVTHLPIFIIHSDIDNIPGNSRRDSRRLQCKYSVIDNAKNINKSSDNPTENGNMYISVRGRSSRYYKKKQYLVTTLNDSFKDKDVALARNLPPDSKWIINGSFIDYSMIRNYMLFTISGEIMNYAPRTKLCEVISVTPDGKKEYQGVYTIIEKIKVSKDRVDITPYNKNFKESSYILQLNLNLDNIEVEHLASEGIYTTNYDIEYPNVNELTEQTEKYIRTDIVKIEKALNDALYTQNWNEVEELIDLNSFADYFIINEFFQNYDATSLSTYLYKDIGGKLCIGPVWDFDGSFNNFEGKNIPYNTFSLNENFFYFYLSKDPEFIKLVQNKYSNLRKDILSDTSLLKFIDECDIYLKYPAQRNTERWYKNDINLYNNDIIKMKKFVVNRGKWMDEHIDDLDIVRMIK